jgi:tricorn protease
MSNAGYYRYPTLHDDTVVFVSEDDLWTVPSTGGVARRLTSNRGEITHPWLSPDGTSLAFVGREEGAPDIYVMPAAGGPLRRLTFLASPMRIVGWNAAGSHILFASAYGQMIDREMGLFQIAVDTENGQAEPLPYGLARSIAFGPDGGVVLGRNTNDPARRKRYRGGTAGHLWIDRQGDGNFVRFLSGLDGNIASPMWLELQGQARIYFVSDHEGVGNLYSCTPDGADLRRHTDHSDYYVRHPTTDGRRIIYHAGADLYLYTPGADEAREIEVVYQSPRSQRNRKFAHAGRYIDRARLHPTGEALAVNSRGKAFTFFNFDGPVLQLGKRDGVRYRLADWLNDGHRLIMISDDPGEETLEIHDTTPGAGSVRLEGLDIGRAVNLRVSPAQDKVALSNHRHELLIVDLAEQSLTLVDRSPFRRIRGFDWSPDGRWLAYGYSGSSQTTEIRLFRVEVASTGSAQVASTGSAQGDETKAEAEGVGEVEAEGEVEGEAEKTGGWPNPVRVTRPVLHDVQPAFDPQGRYLYFLSEREFNPVYDGLHFDLGFPWGMRPYLITLRADLPNPFVPHPELGERDDEPDEEEAGAETDDGYDDEDEEDGHEIDGFDEAEDEDGEDDDGMTGDDAGDDDVASSAGAAQADRAIGAIAPRRAVAIRHETDGAGDALPPTPTPNPDDAPQPDEADAGEAEDHARSPKQPRGIRIDLEGIEQRVFAFPVQDARYGQIAGLKDKVIFSEYPIHGSLDGESDFDDAESLEEGTLRAYVFKEFKTETLVENLRWFDLARDRGKLLYASGGRLRVIDAGEKAPSNNGHPRKSGWLDLNRIKLSIDPQSEWEQMFREAWRLQRDQFWTEDMSQVDWQEVYRRYFPLIRRVSSRSEFSDLMWEMQGELGTSHAYEFGGDYRPRPYYRQGYLAADMVWDEAAGGYRIASIIQGDAWDRKATSPLAESAYRIKPGDVLTAINGQALDASNGPAQLLVNLADEEILLTLQEGSANAEAKDEAKDEDGEKEVASTRSVVVRTLADEAPTRYRAWVEANRQRVHEASDGRVGYVHIPDMGPKGYAEFHRGYLTEIDRDGLIVDVRYNAGGHVSQLILEKLARRRIGYDLSRWGGMMPYPVESVAGPLVALTNEHAASDGDVFCHSFKLMQLGPLIGKRTWGGVIGIFPRHPLVDGTVTTQPEFSIWFTDVGWHVENYGTDPDIEVEISPQDYVNGRDPQLERAIEESLRLLAETPIFKPDLEARPNRSLPTLPPR